MTASRPRTSRLRIEDGEEVQRRWTTSVWPAEEASMRGVW